MSVSGTDTGATFVGSDYFPVHSHSEFSWLDGMGSVQDMVAKVAKMGQPGMALTDHGVMAGVIRLYKECQKHGLAPFPGEEFYLVRDVTDDATKTDRFHVGMLALDAEGFHALIRLSSLSHDRDRFHRKPLIDFSDLAAMHEAGLTDHIALTTGCFFGLPIQMLVRNGYDSARAAVAMYRQFFPNTTYVEIQLHQADHDEMHEADVADYMLQIADELGLPVVAGQDSHYCDKEDQAAHDLMKEICYFGDGEDFSFPGGPYHLATTTFMRNHHRGHWDRVEEGHADLLDRNKLILPELDSYKFNVPNVKGVVLPERHLRQMVQDHTAYLFDNYQRRADYELDVIEKMGMAEYFLLVERVTTWCRKQGIFVNARGSANGSLVCYMLGITNVDPIQWNTNFDRFLSLNRKKPPDIDLDVESGRRHEVEAFLKTEYPTMVHMGTYSKLGMDEDYITGEKKGSLMVQYMAARRRQDGVARVRDGDGPRIDLLSVQQVRKGPGTHAAGFVLPGRTLPIEKYLATMLIASSKTTVTQAVMEDVEAAGYVKLDLLGLRTLETINRCLESLGRPRNDLSWIPWDDRKACALLRSGKTDGIFQFEGYATMIGAKTMKVKNTLDAILCLALYRPALMDGGQTDEFLEIRASGQVREINPVVDHVLADTLGVAVFQEQIMEIMEAVSMPFEEYNELMTAVKASGGKIFEYARDIISKTEPNFMKYAKACGIDRDEAELLWSMVVGFTDYGFNRAHATSYGMVGYQMAYLKAHHPLEFMAAVLGAWAGSDKESVYVKEARRLGFSIVRPDVNYSGESWVIDPSRRDSMRKGLLSIKGVGANAAVTLVAEREANGPFQSIEDLIERVPARAVTGGRDWKKSGTLKGTMKLLYDAGALRSILTET